MFEHLFTPIRIGTMELRNRIVVPPHAVFFLPGHGDGIDRVIDYFAERAKGGAAMISMSNVVLPRSWMTLASWGGQVAMSPLGSLNVATDPALIPDYRRLADALHAHGARFVPQLNSGGRQNVAPGAFGAELPLWAPSALPCPRTRQIPKAMDRADIAEVVEANAIAAANMRAAGADGVELFAAQGYLLSEFLSPHTNRRDDDYGGSLGKPDADRHRVGRGDPAGSGARLRPRRPPQRRRFRARRPGIGRIDCRGARAPGVRAGRLSQRQRHDLPPASRLDCRHDRARSALRRAIRRDSRRGGGPAGLRVLAHRHAGARRAASRRGKGRSHRHGRALISDPELPNKAARGDIDDIRLCTYSNQSCIMGYAQGRGVGCVHNMAVGKEAQLGIGRMTRADNVRRVVVVGGGPAGLAAARVAAERGHAVTLFEATERLGGQNLMTARIASRRGYAEVTRWLEHRVRRLNVDIRLGAPASVENVLTERPQAVILATGSIPRRTGHSSFRPDVVALEGVGQDNVLTIPDVFATPERVGRRVVLIDEDPHLSGAYVAEYLADAGRQVTIVTSQLHPARDLYVNFASDLYAILKPKGVMIVTDTLVVGIDGDRVQCRDRTTGAQSMLADVDTIVLAMGNEVVDGLRGGIGAAGFALHVVGDCLAPRRLDDAILDGERAGWDDLVQAAPRHRPLPTDSDRAEILSRELARYLSNRPRRNPGLTPLS